MASDPCAIPSLLQPPKMLWHSNLPLFVVHSEQREEATVQAGGLDCSG
jgi:hypothetical protein